MTILKRPFHFCGIKLETKVVDVHWKYTLTVISSLHVAFRVIMEPVFTSLRLKVAVLFLLTIQWKTGESNFMSKEYV